MSNASNRSLITYATLAALLMAGAIGLHRYRRDQELGRQREHKAAGLVPVTLATVEERPFPGTVPFTGTLLAVNRAELKAEEPGRVTRVMVQEGDRVAAGAVLSAQDEEDLALSVQAAQAQLAQARAQAEQAGRDNDRAWSLLEKRSVTRQSAQQAETSYNAAMGVMHAAESNLGLAQSHLRKSRITAPFAGEVAERLVQPGRCWPRARPPSGWWTTAPWRSRPTCPPRPWPGSRWGCGPRSGWRASTSRSRPPSPRSAVPSSRTAGPCGSGWGCPTPAAG